MAGSGGWGRPLLLILIVAVVAGLASVLIQRFLVGGVSPAVTGGIAGAVAAVVASRRGWGRRAGR